MAMMDVFGGIVLLMLMPRIMDLLNSFASFFGGSSSTGSNTYAMSDDPELLALQTAQLEAESRLVTADAERLRLEGVLAEQAYDQDPMGMLTQFGLYVGGGIAVGGLIGSIPGAAVGAAIGGGLFMGDVLFNWW